MRAALNSLAVVAPDWLRAHSHPDWVERYGPRSEDSRIPVAEAERQAFAEAIGQQGAELLEALFDRAAPEWLRHVPAVERLRQAWVQNYHREDNAVRWRSSENIPPPSRYIGSLPMMKTHITARSAARPGSATRCISPKAVKPIYLCSLPMWKPRLRPSLMMP